MIPTIEDIVAGLFAGKFTNDQCILWLHQHIEQAYQGGRSDGPNTVEQERRDLRDHFAAKALQGYLASEDPEDSTTMSEYAESSYRQADAMLKARDA